MENSRRDPLSGQEPAVCCREAPAGLPGGKRGVRKRSTAKEGGTVSCTRCDEAVGGWRAKACCLL